MTRVATPPPFRIPTVDDVLWRTYDDTGWRLFDEHAFDEAKHYFKMAQERADGFPAEDYRRGRTLAGLAWSEYRLAQEHEDNTSPSQGDDDEVFRQIHSNAERAVTLLSSDRVEQRDRQYQARAHHILGLARIELCRGSAADDSLTTAGRLYRDLGFDDPYLDVLHFQGKLKQCRRQFGEAARLFRTVVDQATNAERKLGALVDLANTLAWTGFVREASQLQIEWRRLDRVLDQRPEETRPADLLFRGRLLFARVNLLYGDFDAAERILQTARAQLCECPGVSAVCQVVYWLILAELALHRGQFACVLASLEKATLCDLDVDTFGTGYSCLDIVAIDAACRRCVIETCTYECIRRRCILRRRTYRISFTTTTTEMKPIRFREILLAIADGIRAEMHFNAGQLAAADDHLRKSRAAIEEHVDPQSPLLLNLILLQAELAQTRMTPETDVARLLQHATDIVQAIRASAAPLEAARHRLLANWRVQLSDYAAAVVLYQQSLQHGLAFRISGHPIHEFLLIQFASANAIAKSGHPDNSKEHEQFCRTIHESHETIYAALAGLTRTLGCDDYRILLGKTMSVWLCVVGGGVQGVQSQFQQLTEDWHNRDERLKQVLNQTSLDPRQGLALLGTIAVKLQLGEIQCPDYAKSGKNSESLTDPFEDYVQLLKMYCRLDGPQIAMELNRTGELLCRVSLERAADCFFAKADSLKLSRTQGQSPSPAVDSNNPPRTLFHRGLPVLRRLRRR